MLGKAEIICWSFKDQSITPLFFSMVWKQVKGIYRIYKDVDSENHLYYRIKLIGQYGFQRAAKWAS